jgi:hypothetical protein
MPKGHDHGKKDLSKIAKEKGAAKVRQIAKARPSGESARSLKAQDIRNWKEGNK